MIDDQVATYEFDWHCCHVTLRLELHHEYFTVSAFVDLSLARLACGGRLPTQLANVLTKLDLLGDLLRLTDKPGADAAPRDSFAGISEICLYKLLALLGGSIVYAEEVLTPAIADEFADFRGLVIAEDDDPRGPGDTAAAEERHPIVIRRPFWRNLDRQRPATPDVTLTRDDWDLRCEAMWPFVTAPVGERDLRDYEFTASLLLDQRALYISALGAQPDSARADDAGPLLYWIFTHRLGGWATGRLLETIHHQGTLRLAALSGFKDLRAASDKIRSAEETIKIAFAGAPKAQERQQPPAAVELAPGEPPSLGEAALRARIAALDLAQSRLVDADALVADGVGYRVERSRFYISRFMDGLKTLRIDPVSDYQDYATFVQTKFGGAFGYISMLWTRYERVRIDSRTLFEQNISEENRNLAAATNRGNREIEKIQGVADFALFTGLLPYYVGTLLAKALPWQTKIVGGELGGEHLIPRSYWWLCMLIGAIAAVTRSRWLQRPIRRIVLAWAVLAGGGLFGDMLSGFFPRPHHTPPEAAFIAGYVAFAFAALFLGDWPARIKLAGLGGLSMLAIFAAVVALAPGAA